MCNSFVRWIIKAISWAVTFTGGLFLFLSVIPGIQELAKIWNSDEVVDINKEWLAANFNTPIFYAALFIFFFFIILVGTGMWALLNKLLGGTDYDKGELENLRHQVLSQTTEEVIVLKEQVRQLRTDLDKLQDIKDCNKEKKAHEL